ncbi:hypothetical protein QN345_10105 [Cryobacterium sp. 10I1]|uniref:hypothetical protein n=1 Tax=unclassified Cryobacterium TaxID=2649013 RepID=UPI002AB580B4|nr:MULTISPECIES: hypothetical protein [unclassified Cryobacterium]MDY7540846.1 hypothetical protein [Cryobacterium sp. 5B3]MEB0002475.1 hypothetical protein [Cryobacterium sp. RTC2.1]MEB0203754.1 hypothetical protein [Cryobacterium sp. 5I3]MEB0267441.1 hypothetical protein [Cryobacterium sp. 10I5]MEB0276561.1 hypothetical protein [Cryobacterium sp. 5B3]
MTIVLTDDELVAVAVEQRSEWLGNLPTVSASDAADLLKASARGYRSLAVRSLLSANSPGDSRLAPELLVAVGSAVGQRPLLYVYIADASDPLTVTGSSIAVFSPATKSSDTVTVVVTLASGINEIDILKKSLAASSARAFINQIYLEGFGPARDSDALEAVALVLGTDGTDVLRVTHGVVRQGALVSGESEAVIANERQLDEFPSALFTIL